jgi:hypothetical protein
MVRETAGHPTRGRAGIGVETRFQRHAWLLLAPMLSACAIDDRRVPVLGSEADGVPGASGAAGAGRLEPGGPAAGAGGLGSGAPSGVPGAEAEVLPEPEALSAATDRVDLGGVEVGTAIRYDWVVRGGALGPFTGLSLSSTSQEGLSLADGCGSRLEAGAECTIAVTLTPVALGTIVVALSLGDDAGARVDLTLTARGQGRITVGVEGNGRILSTPPGIDCGATCSALFDPGFVSLQVEPGPGMRFAGIDGASCRLPSPTCSVSFQTTVRLTARFFEPVNNFAFISSTALSPTLGSVSAYDAECNRLATAEGLNTTTGDGFIAAVSSSQSSFVERLRPGVRGWLQPDLRPFADTLEGLFAGEMYYPLARNEAGIPDDRRVITGATADGGISDNCSDWSDPAGEVTVGDPLEGVGRWLEAYVSSCGERQPVVCLGNTRTAPLAFEPVRGQRIWRTTTPYVPGSMPPDEKCEQEKPSGVAVARALVAYTDRPASDVLDPAATYVRLDGTLVGTGAQLVASSNDAFWENGFSIGATIQTGIWQDAAGGYTAAGLFLVWNGARDMLTPALAEDSCDDWTATTGSGLAGIVGRAQSGFWTRGGTDDCTAAAVLDCVESSSAPTQ